MILVIFRILIISFFAFASFAGADDYYGLVTREFTPGGAVSAEEETRFDVRHKVPTVGNSVFEVNGGLRLVDSASIPAITGGAIVEAPADGVTTQAASSNWSFDHTADSEAHQDEVTLAGAYDYLTRVDQVITLGQIDLTTDVSGVLPDASIPKILTINSILNDADQFVIKDSLDQAFFYKSGTAGTNLVVQIGDTEEAGNGTGLAINDNLFTIEFYGEMIAENGMDITGTVELDGILNMHDNPINIEEGYLYFYGATVNDWFLGHWGIDQIGFDGLLDADYNFFFRNENVGRNMNVMIDGNLSVGGTIDQLVTHTANASAHHVKTVSADIDHDLISGVSADDHHAQLHTIASHSDTTATGAELNTLTDNSIADTLHRHAELVALDGSPDPAVYTDNSGDALFYGGIHVGDTGLGVITFGSGPFAINSAADILTWTLPNDESTAFVMTEAGGSESFRIDTDLEQIQSTYDLVIGDVTAAEATATAGQFSRFGQSVVGTWANSANYASFSHYDMRTGSTNYALIQSSGGLTLLNAASGSSLIFRTGNVTGITLDSSQNVTMNNNLDVDSLDVTNDMTVGGGITPGSMTDAAAANNTIYYSTTQSKLVYKDSGGTVNNLY